MNHLLVAYILQVLQGAAGMVTNPSTIIALTGIQTDDTYKREGIDPLVEFKGLLSSHGIMNRVEYESILNLTIQVRRNVRSGNIIDMILELLKVTKTWTIESLDLLDVLVKFHNGKYTCWQTYVKNPCADYIL